MLTAKQKAEHRRWLTALTGIPTASACEQRVVEWVVEWVSGMHGRYFRPYYVDSLLRQLDRFLQDRPRHSSSLAGIESSFIMAIHKIPMLFQAYMKAFRLAERVLSGKKVKLNRYTGELEA